MTQAGTGSPHCPLGHTEGHLRATRRAGTNMGVSTATRGQPSRLSNSQSSQSICEGAGGASGACARGPPPPNLAPLQSEATLRHSEPPASGACAREPPPCVPTVQGTSVPLRDAGLRSLCSGPPPCTPTVRGTSAPLRDAQRTPGASSVYKVGPPAHAASLTWSTLSTWTPNLPPNPRTESTCEQCLESFD